MINDKIASYFESKRTTQAKSKKIYRSFIVLDDGKLAEEITNPDPVFAVYDPSSEKIENKPTVTVGGKYIYPVDGDLVTKKVILFPEHAEIYQDTEILRKEITSFIHKYVDIHPFYEELASYYVLLTWLFDKNTVITYLGIFGDYGSGKTRAAQVIGSLCYKPAFVSGALTCAPIYRLMEEARGTLIINEFDFDNSDMGVELIKILNNGYEKGLHVLRSESKTFKVEAFDAFSPKVFTYRKKKKDQAFESRLITIPIEETKREDIPVVLPLEYEREALLIRNKLLMFRFKNYYVDVHVDQSIFNGIERRLRQTLYPLLTVVSDQQFINTLGGFIRELQIQQQSDRGMSWIADYLTALIELTCDDKDITVKALAEKYNHGKEEKEQVSTKKAGYVVRNELKLKTCRLTSGENKGQYAIKLEGEKIKALCVRYGIEIQETSSLYSPSSPQVQLQSEHSEGGERNDKNNILETTTLKPCYSCGSKRFWKTESGVIICAICHPPDHTNQAVDWIDLEHSSNPKIA